MVSARLGVGGVLQASGTRYRRRSLLLSSDDEDDEDGAGEAVSAAE